MCQDAFTNIKSLSFLRKCNVVWVNVCSNACGEGGRWRQCEHRTRGGHLALTARSRPACNEDEPQITVEQKSNAYMKFVVASCVQCTRCFECYTRTWCLDNAIRLQWQELLLPSAPEVNGYVSAQYSNWKEKKDKEKKTKDFVFIMHVCLRDVHAMWQSLSLLPLVPFYFLSPWLCYYVTDFTQNIHAVPDGSLL